MSIKKWILFFLGIYVIYYYYCGFLALTIVGIPVGETFNLLEWLHTNTPLHFSFIPEDTFLYGLSEIFYSSYVVATYFYAKLFGFFKCVDDFKINAVLKFLFVVLITAIFFAMLKLPYILTGGEAYNGRFSSNFKMYYSLLSYSILSLPLHFIIYKLFQFLSIKFPKFALIGKYTSKDFYFTKINNLFTKIKNKFSKGN